MRDTIGFITPSPETSVVMGYQFYPVYLVVNNNVISNHLLHLPAFLGSLGLDFAQTEIFTCSCGSAGCAGFMDWVTVRKADDTFTEIDLTSCPATEAVLGTHKLSISTAEIRYAVEHLLKVMKLRSRSKQYPEFLRRSLSHEPQAGLRYRDITKAIAYYRDLALDSFKFNAFVRETAPRLNEMCFTIYYEGQVLSGYRELPLNNLIRNLLNLGPYPADKSDTYKLTSRALRGLQAYMEKGDHRALYKQMVVAHAPYGLPASSAFYLDNLEADHTLDWSKLTIQAF